MLACYGLLLCDAAFVDMACQIFTLSSQQMELKQPILPDVHAADPHVMYTAFDGMIFVVADIISTSAAAAAPKRAQDARLQCAHTSPTSLYYYVVVSQ